MIHDLQNSIKYNSKTKLANEINNNLSAGVFDRPSQSIT